MLRTDNLPLAFRTLKPLYEHRQATPYGPVYLAENWSMSGTATGMGEIWPGMVACGPIAENPTRARLAVQAADRFFGLFTHNCNTTIDELHGGGHVTSVWFGEGSCWRIYSPAYDDTVAYAVPTDGTEELLTWDANGCLTTDGGGNAVGNVAIAKLLATGTNFIEVQLISPVDLT